LSNIVPVEIVNGAKRGRRTSLSSARSIRIGAIVPEGEVRSIEGSASVIAMPVKLRVF
jgi:hypothetical protein